MEQAALLKFLWKKKEDGEGLLQEAKKAEAGSERLNIIRKKVSAWDSSITYLANSAGVASMLSKKTYSPIILAPSEPSDWKDALISGLEARLIELNEIIDLLEELSPGDGTKKETGPAPPLNPSRVFLVHGHDEATREKVARFLERVGLKPVILHEQASAGRTVIEKLENNADVGYAVVLLTADDVGKARGEEKGVRPRARQNVVFEAGFFIGRLGRERVALLYEPGVELPSDLSGLVYIELDKGGAWKERLFKELSALGFDVSPDAWLGSGSK